MGPIPKWTLWGSRIEVIGGLIPQKPLIQINQDNRRLTIGGSGNGDPTTQEQIEDAFNLVRLALAGDPGATDPDMPRVIHSASVPV